MKKYLLESYRLGKTLAEANQKFYRFLLREHFSSEAIKFFDPQNEEFINFSQPFLLKEALKTNPKTQVNAFIIKNYKRQTIFKSDDEYYLRSGERVYLSGYTLVPNLYTRSILQDAFLNAKYYLAGESERVYLSSLKMRESYEFHEVAPAKIIPRFQGDIISLEDKIFLKKTRIITEEKNIFRFPFHFLKKKLLFKKYQFDALKMKKSLTKLKQDYIEKLKKNHVKIKTIEKQLYNSNKHAVGGRRKTLTNRSNVMH